MDAVVALAGILGALAVGVVSPGPSFVLVARTSVAVSRRAGLASAVGMGLGGVLFGGLALAGLHAILSQVSWLYAGLKLAGGGYLVWLAVRIWRGAPEPLSMGEGGIPREAGVGRAFSFALMTQVSNPKTAIVYGSVFAALLPPNPPGWLFLALPPLIFLLETGWYAVVAVAFSAGRPRAAYLRWKSRIDRVAAGVIGALGLRLVLDAARPS